MIYEQKGAVKAASTQRCNYRENTGSAGRESHARLSSRGTVRR